MVQRAATIILLSAWFILGISCSSITVHPWTGQEEGDAELIQGVDEQVRALMRGNHIPGLSIGIVDNEATVVLRGYGYADTEGSIPAAPDTVFTAYSIAKVFTALETVRLAAEGMVDLDAPLVHALPEWPTVGRWEESEPVTIRHLLSHRGGLPRNSNYRGSLAESGPDTLRLQVASLEQAWAAYPAGSRYKYSNVGFNVLGRLIELHRGEPFAEYMTGQVLPALGLERSTFLLGLLPEDTVVATGYEYYQGTYYPYQPHDITQLASGNLRTSAADLTAFMKAVLAAGQTAGDVPLGPEILDSTYEVQFARSEDPQRNGLGWMTSEEAAGELMVWHQGGDVDANALVAMLPHSGLGVCILTNCGSFDGSALVGLAVDIFGAMREDGSGEAGAQSALVAAAESADPRQVTGRYIAFGDVVEILVGAGELKARWGPATLRLQLVGGTELGTVYSAHHWLEDLRLGGLLPIDLSLVRLIFPTSTEARTDHLIVAVSDLAYEYCPRYPEVEEIPELWLQAEGKYDYCEIILKNGMLRMTGVGHLVDRNSETFVVLGGPYAGESVVFDSQRRTLHHQGISYMQAATRGEPR